MNQAPRPSGPDLDVTELAVPSVRGLTPYEPGKPLAALEREYGIRDAIKLASNENPLGASPAAQRAAAEAVGEMHRYPEGSAPELRARLAERHGVTPEAITLGNGSNDILELLGRAFLGPDRAAVYSDHAFVVYRLVTQAVGAEARVIPALPADHPNAPYGHDLAGFAAALDPSVRMVFIANPNNPTGTWVGASALETFIERVPPTTLVVVDEAYVEYADPPDYASVTPWLERFPNLIVTRSFSKVFGLSSLRLGYALSHPAVSELLNRLRQPFNVNGPAQAAGLAALDDTDHIARSVAENRTERARLTDQLRTLGLDPLPSAGNFVTVGLGGRNGSDVFQGLLQAGVITRPLAGYGLPGHLRISVGRPVENTRCLEALPAVLEATAPAPVDARP